MAADQDAPEASPESQEPAGAAAAANQGVMRIYPPTAGAYAVALGECRTAFNSGDIGSARRLAHGVVDAEDASQEERGFAKMILDRTALDPVAIGAGLVCFLLFWGVIYWYLWR